MRPLIIIDFSHTSSRMLFSAITQTKPKKKDGKYITELYLPYYKHLMFNSIQFVKNKFNGDVVIAMDSRNNWRKDFYSEYKQHRTKTRDESDINFEEYFVEVEKLGEKIKEMFPFKVIKVPKTEADDIAGVLCYKFGNERKIVLVTSDHDWKQVMAESSKVEMWCPIKKEFQLLNEEEKGILDTEYGKISRFSIKHALIGDKGDNIPSVFDFTEFSPDFIAYLRKNEIFITSPIEFSELSISEKLIENFDVFRLAKSGKNKGKPTDSKNIFKTVRVMSKRIDMITETSETLKDFLNENIMYKQNFLRNLTLVDFFKIPDDLSDLIVQSFNSTVVNYNPNEISKYFMNEGLTQLAGDVSKFFDLNVKSTSSIDDFF